MRAEVARDRAVAELAAVQHGVVTVRQLLDAGLTRAVIGRRAAGGWLVRRHQGIYQVGVFGGPFGREMAALLAAGPDAVISHRSAIRVFALGTYEGPVEVSCIRGLAGNRLGIRSHRGTTLTAADVVEWHGLRVTTPGRTLVDLAGSSPPSELERLIEEIQVQRLATPAELLDAIVRGAGRPGVVKLRAACDLIDEPSFTRSEAERRLRRLVKAAGLPAPRTNVHVAGWEVDAAWPRERLVVEVDGYRYHRTRAKFERDRRKDGELLVAGYAVLRITWRQLTREPEIVIAMIAAALVSRRP